MQFTIPRLEELVSKPGLDGPFRFNDRIVYYDPLIDRYWDPTVQRYLYDDEIMGLLSFINGKLSVGVL